MKFATHSGSPPDDAAIFYYNADVHVHLQKELLVYLQVYFTFVLHTGDVMLERVSPGVIVLDPPEKLVIETRASGGYGQFDYVRNGNPFGSSSFTVTLQEFPNFFEIFVREPTTANDLGVYEVEAGPEVDFTVTPYSEYMYVISCVVFDARFLFTVITCLITQKFFCMSIFIPVFSWVEDKINVAFPRQSSMSPKG